MTQLLLDTSVWIEYLRDTGSPACLEVGRLLSADLDLVATTPPIVMELLAGATDEGLGALERLATGLSSLELAPELDFHSAAAAYRAARRGGITVRGLVDCLIAVIAQRHGAVLVHRDADLAVLSALLRLPTVDLR